MTDLERRAIANASDARISGPLWFWAPRARLAVLSERRRRFGFCLNDDEERF